MAIQIHNGQRKNMNSHLIDLDFRYLNENLLHLSKTVVKNSLKKLVEKPLWKNILRKISSDNLKFQMQKPRWTNCWKNSAEITWRKNLVEKLSGKAQWKNSEEKLGGKTRQKNLSGKTCQKS